jgi:hypothetical protein
MIMDIRDISTIHDIRGSVNIYEKPWGQKNTPNFFRGLLVIEGRFWF